MTERAYTNDEIAELEGLRASIKAIDDAPVERYRAALAVLRGDPAQGKAPTAFSLWLTQQIEEAAANQTRSYAMATEYGQRQGERWHARQCALYEAKLKFQSSDGGGESRPTTASGSGPLPEPIVTGEACSAIEPPYQAAETVGRHQELKRAAGVATGPSDTSTPQAGTARSEPVSRERIVQDCIDIAQKYDDCGVSYIVEKLRDFALVSAEADRTAPPLQAMREDDLSHVFSELDDIEVDGNGMCRWTEVANAQTLMKLELRTALQDWQDGFRAALQSSQPEVAPFDPTNHHNALKCPYCNPQGLKFEQPPGHCGQTNEVKND